MLLGDMLAAVLALGALGGVADGLGDVSRASMPADTVDYGQWRAGKRQEGMVFATNIVTTELASALAGAAAAVLLAAVGYVANADQSPSDLQGLHTAFTVLSAVLAALSPLPLLRDTLSGRRLAWIAARVRRSVWT